MSVLVKVMHIPKSCYECDFNSGEYGRDYYEKCSCTLTFHGMNLKDYKHRPKDCPLVEVPTNHGRLIDADYLKEHIYAFATNGRPLHKMELSELLEAIDDVPTVIEEEE